MHSVVGSQVETASVCRGIACRGDLVAVACHSANTVVFYTADGNAAAT